MDQSRDTLKKEYKEFLLWSGLGENEFRKHCIQFLEEHGVKSCFKFLPLNDIGHEFLEKAAETEDAKYHHLCNVFQQFENYAARLLVKPWCKDLYTIKVYTGYFKYNFERWISTDTVYRVFELIGYKTASPGTLILKPPPDEKRLLALALDLHLAHTQLYRLRKTEFLSSGYLMKDVMDGWLSTTGNPVNIIEWLGKNKLETKEPCGFKETYLLNTEAPSTTRSEFVTINGKVSHFDKNGHSVKSQFGYPPGFSEDEYVVLHSQQGENNASGNSFTSLVTTDFQDSDLYGSGVHDTSPAQNSKIASGSLEAKASFSMPHITTNGNYENIVFNKNYMDENIVFNKMGYSVPEDSGDHDRRMHSSVQGHGMDGILDSTRYYEILDKRIRNGQKCCENQNGFLNKDFVRDSGDDCKNSSPISTSYYLRQDVVESSAKCENASERKTIEERQLSRESFPNNFSDNCFVCGGSPALICINCKEIACNGCYESVLKKRPCLKDEHECCRISTV